MNLEELNSKKTRTIIENLEKTPIFKSQQLQSLTLLQDQGFSNTNYLLTTNICQYIVRYLKQDDIDRDFEFRVQLLAYEYDIAAKPILLDMEKHLMVSEYIEGHHKSNLSTEEIKSMAKLLRRLHSITVDREPYNLKNILENKSKDINSAFETIEKYKPELVLCHHDLNPQNILFCSDRIKLIDWEYAGINDKYFDLASISVEFDLDSNKEHIFLASYFDDMKIVNYEKLSAFKIIYIALCTQWWKDR